MQTMPGLFDRGICPLDREGFKTLINYNDLFARMEMK